jgi:hypothetical protein
VFEGRIPRRGYSFGKQVPRTGGQFWNAEYQELGTVFEGRTPRTVYIVRRRDTKDWVLFWKAVIKDGGSFGMQDTKNWVQCLKAGYLGLGTVLELWKEEY